MGVSTEHFLSSKWVLCLTFNVCVKCFHHTFVTLKRLKFKFYYGNKLKVVLILMIAIVVYMLKYFRENKYRFVFLIIFFAHIVAWLLSLFSSANLQLAQKLCACVLLGCCSNDRNWHSVERSFGSCLTFNRCYSTLQSSHSMGAK